MFAVVTIGGANQAIDLVRDVLDGGEIMVIDRQPPVITQIRELGRLETASYTVEKVLEGGVDQGNDLLNLLLGGGGEGQGGGQPDLGSLLGMLGGGEGQGGGQPDLGSLLGGLLGGGR